MIALANAAWRLANLRGARRFARALRDPGLAQAEILRRCLRANEETDFGKQHGFAGIRTSEEFQRRVPVSRYEDYREYVERIARGERNVLTREAVKYFALSSGSASAEKWVPYTKSLLGEFGAAIGPWIVSLFGRYPAARGGPAYWSISPVGDRGSRESVVPVGFDEDSAYLGGVFKRVVEWTLAVPGEARHVSDMEAFRYVTLLGLLRAGELRVVSVWHPSFFTLLLGALERHWERLLEDVRMGGCEVAGVRAEIRGRFRAQADVRRASELARIGPGRVAELWPHLAVISCWRDAQARGPAEALGALFPKVAIQGKGLLSTEGFVSVPIEAEEGTRFPLAIRSHFLEFSGDDGRVRMAGELEVGGEYGVVITTGGGLYRYDTGDRVRVTGRLLETPCVEFLGKTDLVSDRFGEKLHGVFVAEVIETWRRRVGVSGFAMLAPDGAGYTLFVERAGVDGAAAELLDELLGGNPHYRYCRELGQLAGGRVFCVSGDAPGIYLAACQEMGQRLGNIKPVALHVGAGWGRVFLGGYVEEAIPAA